MADQEMLDFLMSKVNDQYRHRLINPLYPCTHGNGENCDCQLPWYEGLYVWGLTGDDDRVRHVVARMRVTYDGGMREFIDPSTGEVVGCCGANWAHGNVLSAEDFIKLYS